MTVLKWRSALAATLVAGVTAISAQTALAAGKTAAGHATFGGTAVQVQPPGVGNGNGAAVRSTGVMAVALTRQECVGLGGKVTGSDRCRASNQEACAVVDPNGVITVRCIDEVAQ